MSTSVKTSLAQIQSFVEALHNQGAQKLVLTLGTTKVEVEFSQQYSAEQLQMLMKEVEVNTAMDKLTTTSPADAAEGAVASLLYNSAG